MAGLGLGQEGIYCIEVLCAAKLLADRPIAQKSRHPRERLQVVGARRFWRQQKKYEVDRLLVDRIEVHRRVQPQEHALQALQTRKLTVGDGNSIANPGRAKPLALQQNIEDLPLVQADDL